MIGLEGTIDGHVEITALVLRQLRQLDAEMLEMGFGNLLVKLLGKHVNAHWVFVVLGPKLDLGKGGVGEVDIEIR